ncbi:glycosyl hydrolase family protein [Bacillus sp. HMF5848]|uniref:carbohydrate binding domain-containing protein n=1 Tax=Bacillus sp. HMF5848 TaxID=2495421 RepID=UPI000F7AE871|nr:carbohydrate binding domain-containing protein [Bacillus sp. HMF5848]RSK25917.1 glycosyl hydrolase family protein [Bacillus sp. HMF5848]
MNLKQIKIAASMLAFVLLFAVSTVLTPAIVQAEEVLDIKSVVIELDGESILVDFNSLDDQYTDQQGELYDYFYTTDGVLKGSIVAIQLSNGQAIEFEGFKTAYEQASSVSESANALEILVAATPVSDSVLSSYQKLTGFTETGAPQLEPNNLWTLVWSDEFNGDSIDRTKWTYDIGNWIVDADGNGIAAGWGNNEKEYYTDSPENSYIEDGKLVIKAIKEEQPITDEYGSYDYTSAKLKTKGLFSKKYGRFEIKAKTPEGKGYWPAIWMLPENDVYGGWAASGEIDIFEGWGSQPHLASGAIHYGDVWPNNKFTGKHMEFPNEGRISDFHEYALEWEPGEIRWYVDGELYQTQTNWYSINQDNAANFSFPAPFDQEFYMILNLAVGGWFDGDPDETTEFPQTMEVDYVRVYDLTGRDYLEPVEPAKEKVELPAGAKQPLEDGNLIYDNTYEQPFTSISDGSMALDNLYWNLVYLPDFGGQGTIVKDLVNDTNFAKINITNPGNQLYSLQLIQHMSLGQNGVYKVSFDAKSSEDRTIMVKASGGADRGWAKYSDEETISLTDTVQSYEFTFNMLNETDLATRLEFNVGGAGTAPVWIGNVRVEDITGQLMDENAAKEPLPSGNHVYNGTFDQGSLDRMTFWNVESNNASATGSVAEATRELFVDITDGGSTPGDVKVIQRGMNLLALNDYSLNFNARAEEARDIVVSFVSKDGTSNYIEDLTIPLTTSMDQYEIIFTMPDVTDVEGQLVFNVGGDNAGVYVDNVSLIRTSDKIDYSKVDLYPLDNGAFTGGLEPWGDYVHNDAVASVTGENDEAKISITSQGNEAWSVLLEQTGMKLSKSVDYVVSFDARSTMPRDLEVTLENAQYTRFFNEVVSLTSDTQNYSYEFKMAADETVSLKFLLGKINDTGIGAHDVFIDNVVFEVKNAADYDNGSSDPGQEEPTETETNYAFDFNNNIIVDGAFDIWEKDEWSGNGAGTLNNEEGKLTIDVTSVGSAYSPQVFQEGMTFENGETYLVSFTAKSAEPKTINVNVGKALTEDPWWTAYAPTETYVLDTTMKAYNFTFTMTEETFNNGKIVFELGTINGDTTTTTVTIDNVNVVKLSSITDNTAWNIWENDEWSGPGAGTLTVDGTTLTVDVTSVGSAYSPQVFQEGMTFENGKEYVVMFDASSEAAKTINVNVGKALSADPWWTAYAPTETYVLGTETKTYAYSFTMTEETFDNGKMVFEFGEINGDTTTTVVTISDVRIISDARILDITDETTVEEPVEETVTESVYYDFDDNIIIDDLFQIWEKDAYSGNGAGTLTNEEGKLTIDVTSVGSAYSPQVFQEGMTFENGETYLVSFTAKSAEPKTINVNVGKALTVDPWWTAYAPTETYVLDTTMKAYNFTFTMTEETFNNGRIVFELGTINGDTTTTTVTIDNVNVVKLSSITDNTAWNIWENDEWSGPGAGTLTVEDATLTVDVTSVGGAYSPQVFQEGMTFENGKEYVVMFEASAEAPKTINVNVGKALSDNPWWTAYAPTETYVLGTETKLYAYSFTMTEETFNNGKIVFEFGEINGDTTTTVVTISDVRIISDARILDITDETVTESVYSE